MQNEYRRTCNGCGAVVGCYLKDGRHEFYNVASDKDNIIKSCPQCGSSLLILTTENANPLDVRESSAPEELNEHLGFLVEDAKEYREIAQKIREKQEQIRHSMLHELPRNGGSFHLLMAALELHSATASNLETLGRLMQDGVEGLYKPLS